MKHSKRKVVVLSLLICLLALLSTIGSLAWFSDSENVTNEFLVAGSDDGNADNIFSVDVWEYTPEGTQQDDDGHEYKDILPGAVLTKEPHIENTGAYDQYVRVTVTISDAQAWMAFAAANPTFKVTDVFVGYNAEMWRHVWNNMNTADPDFDPNATEIVYVMYYKDVLVKGTDITLFNSVKIPEELTQAQAALFEGGFTINIKADAVQTENVVPAGTPAEDAAFEAFKTVGL